MVLIYTCKTNFWFFPRFNFLEIFYFFNNTSTKPRIKLKFDSTETKKTVLNNAASYVYDTQAHNLFAVKYLSGVYCLGK